MIKSQPIVRLSWGKHRIVGPNGAEIMVSEINDKKSGLLAMHITLLDDQYFEVVRDEAVYHIVIKHE